MSSFIETLSTSTSRKDVATAVVTVQVYLGLKANSIGTLIKKPVEELHEMLGSLLNDELTFNEDGEVVPVVEETLETSESLIASTAKNSIGKAERAQGHALYALGDVITVTTKENPKRQGSGSYLRFDLLHSGMTVRDYLASVAHVTGSTKRARRTLRKAVAAGLVTISTP